MRLVPSRYAFPKPAQIKKQVAQIKHLSAPLKGLSLSSQLVTGDPLSAPILDNWIVDEDRIRVRGGTFLWQSLPVTLPVEAVIPYYGNPQSLLLACNLRLYTQANAALDGRVFTSNDWAWTSISNLGDKEYTVLVNGDDGVWSWDGGTAGSAAPKAITSLSNANPAVATVAAADIASFANGNTVTIAGGVGAFAVANGAHIISSVGTPANTFTLLGVDTSAGGAPQTTGLTAIKAGSLYKENVRPPATASWVLVNEMDKVLVHMNRLWFADSTNLAVYYLPLLQKSGELKVLPLNALFRRGGNVVAIYTWTLDGGAGMDDCLVVCTSNGEAAIYRGIDPDDDFSLVGVFRFDAPMSKNSVINYGGDLYILTSTGLLPMSTLIRAETEQLGKADKNVFSEFWNEALAHRSEPGWMVVLDHHTGVAICNLPLGGGRYKQMVRFMPDPIWATWSGLNARCWNWINGRLLFGSTDGKLYELSELYLNDNGNPIVADVQFAWSTYNTPALKHFKMVLPYIISDGVPRPYIDMKVDYDSTPPLNQPDVTFAQLGATWDVATWDIDYWAAAPTQRGNWQGVGRLGRVGAPRIKVSILNCTFALAAVDVIYEEGAAVG